MSFFLFKHRILISEIFVSKRGTEVIHSGMPAPCHQDLPARHCARLTWEVSISRTHGHPALVGHAAQRRETNKKGFSACHLEAIWG